MSFNPWMCLNKLKVSSSFLAGKSETMIAFAFGQSSPIDTTSSEFKRLAVKSANFYSSVYSADTISATDKVIKSLHTFVTFARQVYISYFTRF